MGWPWDRIGGILGTSADGARSLFARLSRESVAEDVRDRAPEPAGPIAPDAGDIPVGLLERPVGVGRQSDRPDWAPVEPVASDGAHDGGDRSARSETAKIDRSETWTGGASSGGDGYARVRNSMESSPFGSSSSDRSPVPSDRLRGEPFNTPVEATQPVDLDALRGTSDEHARNLASIGKRVEALENARTYAVDRASLDAAIYGLRAELLVALAEDRDRTEKTLADFPARIAALEQRDGDRSRAMELEARDAFALAGRVSALEQHVADLASKLSVIGQAAGNRIHEVATRLERAHSEHVLELQRVFLLGLSQADDPDFRSKLAQDARTALKEIEAEAASSGRGPAP
jgi:hypothetical protein